MKRFQFFQATRVCSERSKQTKFDGRSEQNDWTAGKTERRRCSRNSGFSGSNAVQRKRKYSRSVFGVLLRNQRRNFLLQCQITHEHIRHCHQREVRIELSIESKTHFNSTFLYCRMSILQS